MDSTQRLVEKLVERRIKNTGESQAAATSKVIAAFEKLKKNETRGSSDFAPTSQGEIG